MGHTCCWFEKHEKGQSFFYASMFFSSYTTYKCVTRKLLFVVFTMVHQSYRKDKENWQDVKRWAAHHSKLFYELSAWHDEYMTQLLLKTKLSVNEKQRSMWSSRHDMRYSGGIIYIYFFSGIFM